MVTRVVQPWLEFTFNLRRSLTSSNPMSGLAGASASNNSESLLVLVQMTKAMLEKSKDPNLALLSHRVTALQWCGISPAELLMGRRIRTTLPQVTQHFIPKWPYLKTFQQLDKKYKNQQKRDHDRCHRARSLPELTDDTQVWVRTDNLQQSGRVISTSVEPRSYVVSTPTG